MIPRVPHNLRRRIKTHRLTVQQRGRIHRRVIAFDPARRIHQQRKARRVRFRKTILAEPLESLEAPLRKLPRVAVLHHPLDEPRRKPRDVLFRRPRGDRPPQPFRLARREARRLDRQRHHLLLEQRHAQRFAEHLPDDRVGILHRLLAIPPPQVGMHHLPDDRPRPHDRHFDHQVIKTSRLQARQHGHLRPRLNLKYPQRVRAADHVVDMRILRGNGGEREGRRHEGTEARRGGEPGTRKCVWKSNTTGVDSPFYVRTDVWPDAVRML